MFRSNSNKKIPGNISLKGSKDEFKTFIKGGKMSKSIINESLDDTVPISIVNLIKWKLILILFHKRLA